MRHVVIDWVATDNVLTFLACTPALTEDPILHTERHTALVVFSCLDSSPAQRIFAGASR